MARDHRAVVAAVVRWFLASADGSLRCTVYVGGSSKITVPGGGFVPLFRIPNVSP
jgi:hypothetical protein